MTLVVEETAIGTHYSRYWFDHRVGLCCSTHFANDDVTWTEERSIDSYLIRDLVLEATGKDSLVNAYFNVTKERYDAIIAANAFHIMSKHKQEEVSKMKDKVNLVDTEHDELVLTAENELVLTTEDGDHIVITKADAELYTALVNLGFGTKVVQNVE